MKIVLYCEYGQINEIGIGHLTRCSLIKQELHNRKHFVSITSNKEEIDADILVIDHMFSQKQLIESAKNKNIKIVLIDGTEEDAGLVDLSISAFINKLSKFTGAKFIIIPTHYCIKHNNKDSNNNVFVGLGGYDKNNYTEMALNAIRRAGLTAIVANNINNKSFENVKFSGEDYFESMKECNIAITNGGLTFFQALYFGMPTIAIPQYEHQKSNIRFSDFCCVPSKPEEEDVYKKLLWLKENCELRESLSRLALSHVDGNGIKRVCDLIEDLVK